MGAIELDKKAGATPQDPPVDAATHDSDELIHARAPAAAPAPAPAAPTPDTAAQQKTWAKRFTEVQNAPPTDPGAAIAPGPSPTDPDSTHAPVAPLNFVEGQTFSSLNVATATAKLYAQDLWVMRVGDKYTLTRPIKAQVAAARSLAASADQNLAAVVLANDDALNVSSRDGIRGVGERLLSCMDAGGQSCDLSAGFSLYDDADEMAQQLGRPTAVVAVEGRYYLYSLVTGSARRGLTHDFASFDNRVASVACATQTAFNPSFPTVGSGLPVRPGFAAARGDKLILDGKPYTMIGLNCYSLANVAVDHPEQLDDVLKAIYATGANTVRFWAFSACPLESYEKIFAASRRLGLGLKFIPVLGNHWAAMEAPVSRFDKNDAWYTSGYTKDYLPHVESTVRALRDEPDILSWEIMNEPEGDHKTLRHFADVISSRIVAIEQEPRGSGPATRPHLVSLGTLGGNQNGMAGGLYQRLYCLPNISIVTAHDYTIESEGQDPAELGPTMTRDFQAAEDLRKPFFLGEVGGPKLRGSWVQGTPNEPPDKYTPEQVLEILRVRFGVYHQHGIAGALLWGPQPLGYAQDGDGFGFTFAPGDVDTQLMHDTFAALLPPPPAATGAMRE